MKTLFSSQEFFSAQARNAVIKSPVQFLVKAQKTLGLPLPSGQPLVVIYRQLGQTPFYPPNVKGWDGGKSWINTATLTYRYELARELIYGILPEQVGLPKAPSITPTPSPTSALNKALVAESAMAETAVNALAEDPRAMRVIKAQNTLNRAQTTGAPTHNAGQTPPKAPEPQLIPPPAPTPPPRVTGGLPIGRLITADDRHVSGPAPRGTVKHRPRVREGSRFIGCQFCRMAAGGSRKLSAVRLVLSAMRESSAAEYLVAVGRRHALDRSREPPAAD